MQKTIALALLTACLIAFGTGCKQTPTLPDQKTASKLIQDLIIENGNMPGGNRIDIHRFDIKTIKEGGNANTAIVEFQIDFTRYPTSGLDPDRYHEEPMRQIENHQAVLTLEQENWSVTELGLH